MTIFERWQMLPVLDWSSFDAAVNRDHPKMMMMGGTMTKKIRGVIDRKVINVFSETEYAGVRYWLVIDSNSTDLRLCTSKTYQEVATYAVGDHVKIVKTALMHNRSSGVGVVRSVLGVSIGVEVVGLKDGHDLNGRLTEDRVSGWFFTDNELERI